MLILSRKKGERIHIGSSIEITVLAVNGAKVRLGFSAPAGVPIHREEVFRRIEFGLAPSQETDRVSPCVGRAFGESNHSELNHHQIQNAQAPDRDRR